MTRRLLNLLTALSLLLCLAAVGLWGRSYWRSDTLVDLRENRLVVASSDRGVLSFWRINGHRESEEQVGLHYESQEASEISSTEPPDSGVTRDWGFFGFRWYVSRGGTMRLLNPRVTLTMPSRSRAEVPAWFIVLAFLILPFWRVGHFTRARRRRRAGLCPACGYDLRATPGRCPECGTVGNLSKA
jgi:hypothetical protein